MEETEEARKFLEDWFSEHAEDDKFFSEKALDRLCDIVQEAMNREHGSSLPKEDQLMDQDHRVTSLLYAFFGKVGLMLSQKAKSGLPPKAPVFNAAEVTENEKKKLKRIIAACLHILDRREKLKKELAENTISASSIARLIGVDRGTLSFKQAPLRACLLDFMTDYVGQKDSHKKTNNDDIAAAEKNKEDRLHDALRRNASLEMYEVKYRQAIATIAQLQHDLEQSQTLERRTSDKYLKLKDIAEAHGIEVKIEEDVLERIQAEAVMYQKMFPKQDGLMS